VVSNNKLINVHNIVKCHPSENRDVGGVSGVGDSCGGGGGCGGAGGGGDNRESAPSHFGKIVES